jgi:hypothetical protein
MNEEIKGTFHSRFLMSSQGLVDEIAQLRTKSLDWATQKADYLAFIYETMEDICIKADKALYLQQINLEAYKRICKHQESQMAEMVMAKNRREIMDIWAKLPAHNRYPKPEVKHEHPRGQTEASKD